MIGNRLDIAKVVAKRKFKRRYSYELYGRRVNYEWMYRTIRGMRKTGTPCSCWMCGNPRKWFGTKTRQELRYE